MKTNKGIFLWIVLLAVLAGAGFWAHDRFSSVPLEKSHHHEKYQCPMHPQIVQDHPGDCPICFMHLEKVEDDGGAGTQPASGQPGESKSGVAGKAGFTLSQERQQL